MRYFLAFKLGGQQAHDVQKLRKEISTAFDVHKALLIPPHITLFHPFELSENEIKNLEKVLADFAETQTVFDLHATNFSSFDDKVWFIDVEQDARLFALKESLVRELNVRLAITEEGRRHDGVHFHITLAYKDVTPGKFIPIGNFLSLKQVPISTLNVGEITLFRFEDGIWVDYAEWKFGVVLK